MPQENQTDWIEWQGGECPVDGHTRVDVRFRDGKVSADEPAAFWASGTTCFWKHEGGIFSGHGADIIAYRIASL